MSIQSKVEHNEALPALTDNFFFGYLIDAAQLPMMRLIYIVSSYSIVSS